ncbi:CLUMA_CG018205, isoform A [Clunio marinus]|uniref:CLUMA_CG018205, isoform A n=1 Tax=Clunio marinus TaxID=568069 RepID=A0A1J1IYS0_9DIPT|nr:CLUMA_CG018205, isoform A [Clunio marinus]
MKLFLFVVPLIASFVAVTNGQFSKKLDNLNVDMILKNDRILSNYLKCLLDKGPCTSEGRELKVTLPQVLRSGCNNCSDKEKRNSRKVILHIQDKKPQDWAKLEKKYDPTGEFTQEFRRTVQA